MSNRHIAPELLRILPRAHSAIQSAALARYSSAAESQSTNDGPPQLAAKTPQHAANRAAGDDRQETAPNDFQLHWHSDGEDMMHRIIAPLLLLLMTACSPTPISSPFAVARARSTTSPPTIQRAAAAATSYQARTDTITEQLPAVLPNLGGLTCAQPCRAVDPVFHTEVFRATDCNTDPKNHCSTFLTSSSANQSVWSHDSKRLVVTESGQKKLVLNFDGQSASPLAGFSFTGAFVWGGRDLFVLKGSKLYRDVFSDTVSPPTQTLLYDLAKCLPSGFTIVWHSVLTVSSDSTAFAVSFSQGVQDTGNLVLTYKIGQGCQVYDTAAGTAGGGTINIASRFTTIHEVLISADGNWIAVAHEACTAGPCPGGPFFWQIGTTNVNLPAKLLGGHNAMGFTNWLNTANQNQWELRSFADPTNPRQLLMANFPTGIVLPMDSHVSWLNDDSSDAVPWVWSVGSPVTPFPTAYYNELLATSADGSRTWRFAHTESDFNNQFFATQNGICNVSPDGNWAACSTNWRNSFGAPNGAIPCTAPACRGEVVVFNLKTAGTVFQ